MRWAWLLLLLGSLPVSAQAALTSPSAPALTLDEAGHARLWLIQDLETKEAHRASLWRWLWVGGYGALTVGQLVPLPFLKDPGLRVDFAVGAVSTVVGAALLIFIPLEVIGHAPTVQALPKTVEGLAEAERLLRSDSADEDFGVSWVVHAGNVAFNAIVGLVLGLGWRRWESAAVNFGIGVAVGEAMIFTQPHALWKSLPASAPRVALVPLFSPGMAGLALGGTF